MTIIKIYQTYPANHHDDQTFSQYLPHIVMMVTNDDSDEDDHNGFDVIFLLLNIHNIDTLQLNFFLYMFSQKSSV